VSGLARVEEVYKLVETGSEYVCDVGEAKVFRKRKWTLKVRRVSEKVRGVGFEPPDLFTWGFNRIRSLCWAYPTGSACN